MCVQVSLHGGPESAFCQSVIIKPGFCRKTQDPGDAMVSFQKELLTGCGNRLREKRAAGGKAEKS